MCAKMYVCMYVCMHACMHACMYICTYASMHACMYMCRLYQYHRMQISYYIIQIDNVPCVERLLQKKNYDQSSIGSVSIHVG